MKRHLRLLLSQVGGLCLGLLPVQVSAQEALSFQHIDSRQGLSHNSVYAIAQDGDGFMWFGTRSGLNRYDGYELWVHERTPDSVGGLPSDNIQTLYYDQAINCLWVSTEQEVCLYHPATNQFQIKEFLSREQGDTLHLAAPALLRDRHNYVWAGTEKGLYRYDDAADLFVDLTLPPGFDGDDRNCSVQGLYEDNRGVIWIGSNCGVFRMEVEADGTVRFLPKPADPETHAMFDSKIGFIAQDSSGRFWLGAQRNPPLPVPLRPEGQAKRAVLFSWMPGSAPVHYQHHSADPYSLIDNHVRTLAVDNKGRVWVGTFLGLNIYDEASGRFFRHALEVGNPLSLGGGSVRAIHFDNRGSAWVGTFYGGVSYYHPQALRFTHHEPGRGEHELNHQVVSSFWEDALGNIWIGTEGGGINYWDRATDTYRHFEYASGSVGGLRGTNVKTVIGQGDSVWIGRFGTGLDLYRPSSGSWQTFRAGPNGLSNNNVYSLLLHEGQLWIATYSGGLNVMDLTSGAVRVCNRQEEEEAPHAIVSNRTVVLISDASGRIWVGTREGLDRVEKQEEGPWLFHHYLRDKSISTLLCARDSSLWVGTYEEGIFVLDEAGKQIGHFGQEEGLPGHSAFGILEDENGHIWVSTERGLARLDRRDENITSYGYSDGVGNLEYNYNACYQSRSGEMFFGGTQGFTSFFPSEVRTNTFVPPVVFTQLLASNTRVRPGDKTGLLEVSLNETPHLTLPYNDANITLCYAALDYLNPAHNHYAYQLEGLDHGWKYAKGQSEVSYTLQRSGTYTFRLKGGNSDGIWNPRERRLNITVLPPPWGSPMAYGIYAALILLLLVGSFWFIRMRHRLQLDRVVIAQQEELHQTKIRFYTNITHEFRTPLTLILGPVEDLLRQGASGQVERQIQAIQQNAQRLLRLVNQLLDFRSLEHDHAQLQVAPGNFVSFAKEVFLSFREQARIKGIDYRFQSPSPELQLWYDRDKLEKVLYNLLANAFRFTLPEGHIALVLRESGDHITLDVCDSGPGVPEGLRTRIFERYVHDSVPDKHGAFSSGIGLALSRQLIDMHHGRLELIDSAAHGACFRVWLRKGKTHFSSLDILTDFKNSENLLAYLAKNRAQEHEKPNLFGPGESDKPTARVLIVEDNPEVQTYIQQIFAPHFETLLAENGRNGLKQALEQSPDLIISDIMMPEMDGIELCRELKSKVQTSHIPVILLTARTGQIFRVEGLETGADAYLTKPFSPYELQLQVHNLLEARQRIRDRFRTVLKLEPKEITVTSADETFLVKAIEVVERFMDDPDFLMEIFARELAVSRPLLFTKLKALTGQTPNNFVKSLRLKRSVQLLTDSDLGVAEIAYQVGFRDARYFSKCFQKEFGRTPSEYRNHVSV